MRALARFSSLAFPTQAAGVVAIRGRGQRVRSLAARLLITIAPITLCGGAVNAQVNADFTATPIFGTQPLQVSFTNTSSGGGLSVWDFGDGGTSFDLDPVHTFKASQTTSFTVTLTYLTPTDSDVETKVDFITISPAVIDVDFAASVVSGANPLTVNFTDATTGGPVSSWIWDFGDGTSSTQQSPTHTFQAGTTTGFTVSLQVVVGGQMATGSKTDFITVDPAPLVVDFTTDTIGGDPPLTANFADNSTGAVVTDWLWDFGDGNSSSLQNPTNIYALPGSYDVTLTALVGPQAEAFVKTGLITVNPTFTLNAEFRAGPTSGDHPFSVSFENISSGDLITGYLWDFGDGTTSTSTDPLHEYVVDTASTFDVSLTAFTGGQTSVAFMPGLITVAFPFQEHPVTAAVAAPEAVLAVDVDGDGDNDLLTASIGDDTIALFANMDSLGSYGPRQIVDPNALAPIELMSADFDGDGDRDLLSLTAGDRSIWWYENTDALGSFGDPQAVLQYSFSTVWKVGAADIDGDGDQDVVSRNGWVPNVDGSGSFGAEVPIDIQQAIFNVADIDGDGDLDAFRVYNSSQKADESESLDWFRNADGLGGFEYVENIEYFYDIGSFPTGKHALADMDMDGDVDFIYSRDSSIYGYRNQTSSTPCFDDVLIGDAISPFAPSVGSGRISDMELIDMDGDGQLDIVTTLDLVDRVSWRRNLNGFESFAPTKYVATGTLGATAVAAADLDGDGDSDIAVASGAGNVVQWFENSLASPSWPYLAPGLAGEMGNPVLSGNGELVAGSRVNLALENASAAMPAVLVIGFTRIDFQLLGGTLIPFPNFTLKGHATDADGKIGWSVFWPNGLPPGATLYFQFWVVDSTTPAGLSASNGVSSTTFN